MPPHPTRPRMPGYGVPDDPEGVLPWSWAQQRLIDNRNYWVGTIGGDGRPHSTPVWGVWMTDQDCLWFSCATDSFKARNLRADPRIVVTTDSTVECISIEGEAFERGSSVSRLAAIEAFAIKYGDPNLVDFLATNSVFEVLPHHAIGIIEREEEFATRATKWVW